MHVNTFIPTQLREWEWWEDFETYFCLEIFETTENRGLYEQAKLKPLFNQQFWKMQ